MNLPALMNAQSIACLVRVWDMTDERRLMLRHLSFHINRESAQRVVNHHLDNKPAAMCSILELSCIKALEYATCLIKQMAAGRSLTQADRDALKPQANNKGDTHEQLATD